MPLIRDTFPLEIKGIWMIEDDDPAVRSAAAVFLLEGSYLRRLSGAALCSGTLTPSAPPWHFPNASRTATSVRSRLSSYRAEDSVGYPIGFRICAGRFDSRTIHALSTAR